jgi:predicted RNA binding protein YcfA (HicA-like mRNA interferase family)
MSYRELVKLLGEHGWVFKRHGKGDHEIWVKPGQYPITVPRNLKGEGTLQAILKKAGIR